MMHYTEVGFDLTWIDYSCEVRTVFNDLLYKEDMHAGGFFEFFCCMCQSFHNSTTIIIIGINLPLLIRFDVIQKSYLKTFDRQKTEVEL